MQGTPYKPDPAFALLRPLRKLSTGTWINKWELPLAHSRVGPFHTDVFYVIGNAVRNLGLIQMPDITRISLCVTGGRFQVEERGLHIRVLDASG